MAYIQRGDDRAIVAVRAEAPATDDPAGGCWEAIDPASPELVRFLAQIGADDALRSTDLGLVRVLEDLIELLIDRSVIRFTDFPPAAQQKLLARENARAAHRQLRLLEDDDEHLI